MARNKLRNKLSTEGGNIAYPVTMRERAWIERRLKKLGRAKKELADAMGLEASRVSEILVGKRDLKAVEALALSKFLRLDPGKVLEALASPHDVDDALIFGDNLDDENIDDGLDEDFSSDLWVRIIKIYRENNVTLRDSEMGTQFARALNVYNLLKRKGMSEQYALDAALAPIEVSLSKRRA